MHAEAEAAAEQLPAAMLNALTSLEGLLPVLAQEAILQPLLCARPLPAAAVATPAAAAAQLAPDRLLPAPLLGPLLCPQPGVAPQLRNRVAGLVLQVRTTVCRLPT